MKTPSKPFDPASLVRTRRILDAAIFGEGEPAPEPEPEPAPPPSAGPSIPVWMSYPVVEAHLPPPAPTPVRREEPLPPFVPFADDADARPTGSVSDGSGSYDFAALAPGLYEIRRSPAPTARVQVPEPITEPITEPEPIAESERETEVELSTESLDVLAEDIGDDEGMIGYYTVGGVEDDSASPLPVDEVIEVSSDPESFDDATSTALPHLTPDPDGGTGEEEAAASPYALAACLGAAVPHGDGVALSRAVLHVAGPDSPFLVELMLLSPPVAGVLLRDGFALTGGDTFTQEDVDHGRLVYRHDPSVPGESDSFTLATACGAIPEIVFGVQIVAHAAPPELVGCGSLAGILGGRRVRQILDGAVRHDGDREPGMAVVGLTGRGKWEFSLDGGVTYSAVAGVSHSAALLLGPSDLLRFAPFDGWSGDVRLSFRAWDRRAGLAGTFADPGTRVSPAAGFSREGVTATACVAPRTTVPNRNLGCPWEGGVSAYEVVGSGMAVVRLDGPGTWQYSTDAGASWQDVGPMYHGRALLLRADDRIRLLPKRAGSGRVVLGARAWDGRGGDGGARVDLAGRQATGEGTPFAGFIRTQAWRMGE